ncbi:hypothetical protein ERO13_A07G077550v2 [Gossypium hirsutum]|uniref:Uncharacterized protein n=1 Tax=Gossypium darwinii TaxID=34276 RepID=A0A5D2FTN1_GOSDA|nr:hypothetical protein ERO13_A07G077550v2 [Gossypium hirsutum]TYH09377.1 hypothetical protein ES288_A07G090700v1 [Gossypium darwinii]
MLLLLRKTNAKVKALWTTIQKEKSAAKGLQCATIESNKMGSNGAKNNNSNRAG